jgi:hypothetical protein
MIAMKSIILLAFSFVFTPYFAKNLVFESTKSFTSITNEITGELVIGVPNFNMKRYDNFVKKVTAVSEIKNIEFCSIIHILFPNNLISFSQEYLYKFKIVQVTNLAEAKEITVLLRPLFNDEEEPNKYFPKFNLEDHEFSFQSSILVTKSKLEEMILDKGYELIYFERIII